MQDVCGDGDDLASAGVVDAAFAASVAVAVTAVMVLAVVIVVIMIIVVIIRSVVVISGRCCSYYIGLKLLVTLMTLVDLVWRGAAGDKVGRYCW